MPPPQTIISLILFLLFLANAGPSGASPGSPASRHRQYAGRDLSRHRFISHRRKGSRSKPPARRGLELQLEPSLCVDPPSKKASVRLPLYSAADFGVGEYLAELELGTPPRKFKLFADTGSDLTWVKCDYRSRSRSRRRSPAVFEADRSASFKTVPCGSAECSQGLADLFSLTTCPAPSAPCMYNYSYQSNSLAALGIFGSEVTTLPLTNHKKVKLPNIIGCTRSTQGTTVMNGADGVLGLSYSKQSFAYRAASKYGGGRFSYCLVDHLSVVNVTNYLVFGDNEDGKSTIVGNVRHTGLFLHAIEGFYAVGIKGISVGGSMVSIPPLVWDLRGPGGAILDSGTSLTVLATPAYGPVMDALTEALSHRFPSLGQPGDLQPFSYCFNSTGFKPSMVPRIEIHFTDGARFRPHVKSYIIDDEPGVKCIGILEGPGIPYLSIIGNIMQQNYFWEYDLFKQRLGFGASTCRL